MNIRRTVTRLFAIGALLAACESCAGPSDTALDTWEVSDHALRVRLRKLDEWSLVGITMHTYFTFDAIDPRSGRWRQVLDWRIGGPANIQRDRVGLLNDRVAYAFIDRRYVVTVDGGLTWHEWNATQLKSPRPAAISEVVVATNGAGRMRATHYAADGMGRESIFLNTWDYGVHWNSQDK